jgi:hypothetical protein
MYERAQKRGGRVRWPFCACGCESCAYPGKDEGEGEHGRLGRVTVG